ncbi:isoaspartyl peptidase/L-asparaginase family protein [Ferrimonas lipolytica]|uniref:Isoaspartyl peptidase n=1 Tax=Ferrimonas lipolytica TaxID=2724191 RepID=A0A6H1UB73_9GAMM|nr:isoaspartyl peptidase/L-asparaginase [Ferrimonas lipolytica]QIZ76088.1 isoaspartyl peptidase/L-asparaginase [Ferrimonas lipolytica]
MKSSISVCVIASLLSIAPVWAEQPIALALHGGAGTISPENLTPAKQQQIEAALDEALQAGYRLLNHGGSAVDAVEATILVLEDSPLFNAGKGAVYSWDESHQLDASLMSGQGRQAGAVAGVQRVKNPIKAARAVMDDSPHVLLSGSGADTFAERQGLELVSNSYFDTEQRLQSLQRAKQKIIEQTKSLHQANWDKLPLQYRSGTVGAVALDRNGNLAAGTSTGGMTAKRFGRIGDSPIIGAGTFADNRSCAVSATGHGEYFIRYNVAADICARVEYQQVSAAVSANQVINKVLVDAGADGGVVVVDPQGNVASPFNSKGMYRASIDGAGRKIIAIWEEPLVNEAIRR